MCRQSSYNVPLESLELVHQEEDVGGLKIGRGQLRREKRKRQRKVAGTISYVEEHCTTRAAGTKKEKEMPVWPNAHFWVALTT